MESIFLPYYKSVVDQPVRWIMAWLIIIVVMMSALGVKTQGFTHIPFNDGPYMFFSDDNKEFQDLRRMEGTYQSDKTLIFLFTPYEGDVFTHDSLSAIEEITQLAWSFPHVVRVDSIANFQHTEVSGDDLATRYLYEDAKSLTAEEIAHVKQVTLNEKALQRQMIAASGEATIITAYVIVDDALSETPDIMASANKAVTIFRDKYPFAEVQLLGDIPFTEAANMATMESLVVTTPIGMTLVLICLVILFRSVWSILVTQIMIALSIMLAYVIFLLAGNEMSPPSALASPMILTLAVADCVHLLVTYHQQSALGKGKRDAMLESLRINFQPVWLTSITTAIGFLMMNFAEAPPFQDMGNAVFFGVILAFLLSVSLLPALMMLFPQPSYQFGHSQQRYMRSLAQFTIDHHRKLLISMSIVVVVLISFIPLNRVNDVFNEYFDDSYAVRRSLDMYMSEIGGLQRLQFSIPSTGPGGVMEPEYLRNIDKLVQWAETQPNVSKVRSFAEVVKRLNKNMHADDPNFYRIPDERELISQYVLLYEMGLPFGLGLDSQVDISKTESKVEVVFDRIQSDVLVDLRGEVNDWIKQNWPDYMQAKATGLDSLFGDISFDNVKSMFSGTVIALLLVSGLLVFTLGSPRYGLLSLLPNLLPAAMAFGIWGVINGQVGIFASVLCCMTLGVIVDDTVHFLSKYVRARREKNYSAEDATVFAFQTVGVSLIATTIILVANFGVMGFSHYAPNVAMGVLTSMIISIALVLDFFFFVPLLVVLDRDKKGDDLLVSA
ncbi:hypothetical protein A9Q99_10095 [Gammaproteobacteria bacterium 45_16_T64]|nr:hypothetical protein A9Q99_10095 [Gammaproteobacteria bacterium 45_16_T64]